MSLVLANGLVASISPPALVRANVRIEGDNIASVGQMHLTDGDRIIDCADKLLLPGNICAHTHLYSTLARGMPPPSRPPADFSEILELIWWRLDRALDEPAIRLSGMVGAIDAIRAGTTTLIDHHASPNCIDGSLDLLADALRDVGIRAALCYEVTDRGGKERSLAGLRENERFLKRGAYPNIIGMVGAHASFTLNDETLQNLAALSGQLESGVHIHVAEDVRDEMDSMRRAGVRTAHRLDDAGIFNRTSIAAHGVHLDDGELSAIQEAGTWLVHNCRSNLNNGVGRARIQRFGTNSALGTDGIDHDMFAESRTAYFRAREDWSGASALKFTDMLAAGGRLASDAFHRSVGRLEPGAAADIVVLDYNPPTPLDADNLAWHWMFAFGAAHVESVMIDGNWVLRNREICGVDEVRIRVEARIEAAKLWERMGNL